MTTSFRILLVEDSPSDAMLVKSYLSDVQEFNFAVDHAERLSEAKTMIGDGNYQAVLLDLSLPDSHGISGITAIREINDSTPIVVLTGNDDRDLVSVAMSSGADNYLVKDRVDGNRIATGIMSASHRRQSIVSQPSKSTGTVFLDKLEASLLRRLSPSGSNLNEVLEELVKELEEYAGAKYKASILLLNPQTGSLHLGAAPNLSHAYNQAIEGIKVGMSQGSCGTAAFCKHAIYVVDIATDPLWRDYKDLALQHGLNSCWSVPIMTDDSTVLGTFAMYHTVKHYPSDTEQDFIHQAAQAAARIIVHAKGVRS